MMNELNRNTTIYCVNKEFNSQMQYEGNSFTRLYDNVFQLFMDVKELYQNYNDSELIYNVYSFFVNENPIKSDDLLILNECFVFVENSLLNRDYLELFTIFKVNLILFMLKNINTLDDKDRIKIYKFVFGNRDFTDALKNIYEQGILSEEQILSYIKKIFESEYTISKEYIYLFKYNENVFYERLSLFFKHLFDSKSCNDVNKALMLFLNKLYASDYMLLFLLINNINNPNWYAEPILLSNFLNLLLYKMNKLYNKNISLVDILNTYFYSNLNASSINVIFLGLLITIFEKFNLKNLYNAFYRILDILSKNGVFRYRNLYVSNNMSELECVFPSVCLCKGGSNNSFDVITYNNIHFGFEFLAYISKDLCNNLKKYDITDMNNKYTDLYDHLGFVFDFCMILILNNRYYKKFCEICREIVNIYNFTTVKLNDSLENIVKKCIKDNICDYSPIYIGSIKSFIDNIVKVYLEFEKLNNENYIYNMLSFINCYSFNQSNKGYTRLNKDYNRSKCFVYPIYSGKVDVLSKCYPINIKSIIKKYDAEHIKEFLNNVIEYLYSLNVYLPTFDYTYMIFITSKETDYIKGILNRIDTYQDIFNLYKYYDLSCEHSLKINFVDIFLFVIFVLYRFLFTNIGILLKDLNKLKDNIEKYMSLVFSKYLVREDIYESLDTYIDIIESFNIKCNEIVNLDNDTCEKIINERLYSIFSKYNIYKYNVKSLVTATLSDPKNDDIKKIIHNLIFLL